MMRLYFLLATLLFGTLLFTMSRQREVKINWFRPDGTVNWEAERAPTDTVVIHHTAMTAGITWELLSGIGAQKYIDRYADPKNNDPYVFGQVPHSGHFRDVGGQKVEVFYVYHWLIREDGKAERLLGDDEVAWHAGNWLMNCRSIAVCLDGDYSSSKPSPQVLAAVAEIIADYAKKWKNQIDVIGHNDVVKTRCPGDWFHEDGIQFTESPAFSGPFFFYENFKARRAQRSRRTARGRCRSAS